MTVTNTALGYFLSFTKDYIQNSLNAWLARDKRRCVSYSWNNKIPNSCCGLPIAVTIKLEMEIAHLSENVGNNLS
jgi:hypothetical protein